MIDYILLNLTSINNAIIISLSCDPTIIELSLSDSLMDQWIILFQNSNNHCRNCRNCRKWRVSEGVGGIKRE